MNNETDTRPKIANIVVGIPTAPVKDGGDKYIKIEEPKEEEQLEDLLETGKSETQDLMSTMKAKENVQSDHPEE